MSPSKRVALVNVRIEPRQRMPMGQLMLAACIKDRTQVVVFDPDPEERDFKDLVDFGPDLVGIGFMTQTRYRAKEILDVIRDKLPGVKIVLGGVGPTVEPEKTFDLLKPDALVVGEGEKAVQSIVDGEDPAGVPGVYLPGFPLKPADVYEDLDDLPLPAYECMPDFKYYLAPPGGIRGKWFDRGTPMIMSARGCPYKCTFCSSRCMFGRKVRRRSVKSVIEEIRRLRHEYGVKAVYFYDDTFNVKQSWVEEFCDALKREPYSLMWGCQIRVNIFTKEQAVLMRRAGCVQVDIGVESGSPRVLKAISKDETIEDTERAFALCHETGIRPLGNFLIGCPEETREDVEMTKSLIRRIKPAFAEFYFLTPYPGSDLHRQALQSGWLIDRSYEGRGMVDRPVMEINFSSYEQVRIRNEYYSLVSWRNLTGYLSLGVLWSVLRSLHWVMIKAFFSELKRSGNVRDGMQAFVHAMRRYYAEKQRPV